MFFDGRLFGLEICLHWTKNLNENVQKRIAYIKNHTSFLKKTTSCNPRQDVTSQNLFPAWFVWLLVGRVSGAACAARAVHQGRWRAVGVGGREVQGVGSRDVGQAGGVGWSCEGEWGRWRWHTRVEVVVNHALLVPWWEGWKGVLSCGEGTRSGH